MTHKAHRAGIKGLNDKKEKRKESRSVQGGGNGLVLDPDEVMQAMLAEARRGKAREETLSEEEDGSDSEEVDGDDIHPTDGEEDEAESSSAASSRAASPPPPKRTTPPKRTDDPPSRVKAPPPPSASRAINANPFDDHSKPSPTTSFATLGLSPPLITALGSINIRAPTEIQSACIGPILAGRDCIGGAKTGSGKTLAFALPIVERIARDPYGVWAVILTPTRDSAEIRELAYQLTEQFLVVGRPLGLTTVTIVGGMEMLSQARDLASRPHIIVATPGRLCDLLRSDPQCQGKLSRVRTLVLDEADRLLTGTFAPDLAYLFSQIPAKRQTCLFTATISEAIMNLAKKPPAEGKERPFVYRIASDTMTVAGLKQKYLFIPSQIRDPYLLHLLHHPPEDIDGTLWAKPISLRPDTSLPRRRQPPSGDRRKRKHQSPTPDPADEVHIPSTIIFTQRCATAHLLHLILTQVGVPSVPLHSKLSQPQRLASLASFRAREVPVLVTTDVGSRGLDIPEVAMVVNWDCPRHADDYIHRVGRTARAGRGGVAVTIVTERDTELVGKIEEAIGTTLVELALPEGKVLERLNEVSMARRVATMEMHDSNFGEREAINKAKAIKRAKRDALRAE